MMERRLEQKVAISETDFRFIKELYLNLYPGMLSYAKTRLYGPDTEDIVQEVFLIAITKAEAVQNSPNPAGWLYRTLKYELLNEIKRSQRAKTLNLRLVNEERTASIEDPSDRLAVWDLWRCAKGNGVAEDNIKLFLLHHVAGYEYAALAASESITVANCKTKIHRTKRVLEQILAA